MNEQTGTILLSEGKAWIKTDREIMEDRLVALEKFVADLKACSKGERPFSPEPEPKPVAVDPDIAEAWDLIAPSENFDNHALVLASIKRGRALAAAEAKPGMVWVKHDGSSICPIDLNAWVMTHNYDPKNPYMPPYGLSRADNRFWQKVTHYAIITQPEGAA